MKIQCSSEKLKNALSHAERVTGKNLTLPTLSNILFVVTEKTIVLRSTNLSLGIEIRVPAAVEKEGTCAIQGSILLNFLTNIKSDNELSIEQVGETLLIKTKQSKIQIKTFPHDDFPTIPAVEGAQVSMPAPQFLKGLESVYYAAAQTDIKPELGSVYIYAEDDTLVFAATDSFRLSERKIQIEGLYGFTPILIPQKNVIELMRLIVGVTTPIKFSINKNIISLSFESVYLTSRIIDGAFPDYRKIIPKEKQTQAVVLKSELQNALKAGILFTDSFNQITISIQPSKKQFIISSKNSEKGEGEITIDAALSGDSVSLAINHRYLTDVLNALQGDSVAFESLSDSKPLVIKDVSDNTLTALIMPMNR